MKREHDQRIRREIEERKRKEKEEAIYTDKLLGPHKFNELFKNEIQWFERQLKTNDEGAKKKIEKEIEQRKNTFGIFKEIAMLDEKFADKFTKVLTLEAKDLVPEQLKMATEHSK